MRGDGEIMDSRFNSRARKGRDPRERRKAHGHDKVSIHAPARGATDVFALPELAMTFQFTRPQGARHTRRRAERVIKKVSIHAPARGATI